MKTQARSYLTFVFMAAILSSFSSKYVHADIPETLDPLDVFQECRECPEMIVLPIGRFIMGAPPEESAEIDFEPRNAGEKRGLRTEQPIHTVTMDLPYALGRYEVTTGEFMLCVEAGACSFTPAPLINSESYSPEDRLKLPVRNVNFEDIQEYLDWINSLLGAQVYRLPTEAEWEYAARAGAMTRHATGENLPLDRFNVKTPGVDPWSHKPVPVETMNAANAWGFQHIAGNVLEETRSCWTDSHLEIGTSSQYLSLSREDEKCDHVVKGGSYNSIHLFSRPAMRTIARYGHRSNYSGFRIARSL